MGGARPPEVTVAGQRTQEGDAIASGLCQRVHAHLAGQRTTYDDLVLDAVGFTDLQYDLLRALRTVPWGEVVTYGELAALAGRPRAPRAAGAFCAANRYALIAPCHRVVGAGGIGGYGAAGIGLKRRLLALEGTRL
jgi:methylated-DNA-[protein]-cysteine S-methyltransferase